MNPYLLLGAVTISVVAAVGYAIFSVLSHTQESNHRYEETNPSLSRPSPPTRNLTCTFCGQTIVARSYQFPCGHLCHRICLNRAKPQNKVCGFCRNAGEVIEDAPPTSEPNLRRRNVTSSEKDKFPSQEPSASSYGITPKCSFCNIPALRAESVKLPCGHITHSECYELKSVVKCQNCVEAEEL